MRKREVARRQAERFLPPFDLVTPEEKDPKPAEATVTVRTSETHNGTECDCVTDELTLRVGDEVELTHVCHDGRVDKVVARVLSIDVPSTAPEHATVKGPKR